MLPVQHVKKGRHCSKNKGERTVFLLTCMLLLKVRQYSIIHWTVIELVTLLTEYYSIELKLL